MDKITFQSLASCFHEKFHENLLLFCTKIASENLQFFCCKSLVKILADTKISIERTIYYTITSDMIAFLKSAFLYSFFKFIIWNQQVH